MRVGVIGGGISGLSCAYELARLGCQVLVFEQAEELGGELRTFRVGGERLEGFYHHLFLSDTDITALMGELGLGPSLRWIPSQVGYLVGGKIYPFVTPLDLLRFSPLSLLQRVRVGLGSLSLRRRSSWHDLEGVTAQEWLKRHLGDRAFEVVWLPLLRGKFGDYAGEISMAWLWNKVRLRFGSRGFTMARERLGYLEGSFYRVIEALAQALARMGGQVFLNTRISRVAVQNGQATGVEGGAKAFPLDRVVAAIPSPAFLPLVPELDGDYRARLEAIPYLAALVLVLVLRHRFSPVYWLNIGDPGFPFVATIEHTNFISPSRYGGKRVLYVTNYLPPTSPLYPLSSQELLARYLPHLRRINPQFDLDWVEEVHLFRDGAAQPVVGVGYAQKIPPQRTPILGLYLMNATQIYPQDRGMNYSVRLGRQVARLVAGEKGEGRD